MRFFTRIAILFYMVTISTLGFLIIFFVFFVDSSVVQRISYYLEVLASEPNLRVLVGLTGLLFVLLSFIFAQIISGARQKERTIAFDNTSGRVSISLIAMEDMVKRLMLRESEVKESRPNIIATKKGLDIEARLVLRADVNIPELTARLQDTIKEKIQDMIGIEETVTVRIHVVKLISEENKPKRGNKSDYPDKPETSIPFQGYRA